MVVDDSHILMIWYQYIEIYRKTMCLYNRIRNTLKRNSKSFILAIESRCLVENGARYFLNSPWSALTEMRMQSRLQSEADRYSGRISSFLTSYL